MRSLQTELLKHGFRPSGSEVERKSNNAKGKPKERLADWELRELMGVNRDTFKRHKGSVRRR